MKAFYNILLILIPGLLSGSLMAMPGKDGSGQISGKLLDPNSKEPVGFASVGLFSAKDSSLVQGLTSDAAGKFLLNQLPYGNFYLRITLVGYAPKSLSNLALSAKQPNLELGTILFSPDTKKLNEIEIIGQKDLIEYGLDKQVLNVAKDLNATGGTAADALKNAPSVAVDIDGNVSVRGSSNVTVLVDGRNTGQTAQSILSQTPASAIEKIEVITNPSAKYDAEGMGGIINIVLKKQTRNGLNGNASVNVGNGGNYNTSLNLNYRLGKVNFFTGYDFQKSERNGNYELDRLSTYKFNITFLDQAQEGERQSWTHIPKLGFDYQLTEKQTLTASVKMFKNSWEEDETVWNRVENLTEKSNYYFNRLGTSQNNVTVTDYALSYRKQFAQARQELTASAVFSTISGYFNRYYQQINTDAGLVNNLGEFKENFLQGFYVTPFFGQADYVHPVGEKGKIESGLKHSQRVLETDFHREFYNYPEQRFVTLDSASNIFGFAEYISAGYANYGNSWQKYSYQVGLRGEQTNISVNNKSQDTTATQNYFRLFPSVFLSREIDENRKVQVNYSRRINRPHYEALNPFRNYADPLNIWSGNPLLKPEFINSYEASYLQFWKSGSVTATGFYRQVNNLIQQVRLPIDSVRALNTYVNLNNGTSFGLELSGSQGLAKWWKLSGNLSAFNYKVSGSPLGVDANSGRFSWLGRLNSNFTLPKNLSAQISVNYRSPQALAQGTRAAIYNTDFSVKKDLLNKKASLTLRVSDVFNTLRYDTHIISPDLDYDLKSKRQSRFVYLGFNYRIGKETEKRDRRMDPGSEGGMF